MIARTIRGAVVAAALALSSGCAAPGSPTSLMQLAFGRPHDTATARGRIASPPSPAGSPVQGASTFSAATRTTTTDLEAAHLAARVRAGGSVGESALVEALVRSGVPVLGEDRRLMQWAGSAGLAGIAMPLAEAEALGAEAGAPHLAMLLADLATALQGLPGLGQAPLGQMILEDIRASAYGTAPQPRFWARFVAALADRADAGDLLGTAPPEAIRLTSLQSYLILHRIASEWAVVLQSRRPAPVEPGSSGWPEGAGASELALARANAGFHRIARDGVPSLRRWRPAARDPEFGGLMLVAAGDGELAKPPVDKASVPCGFDEPFALFKGAYDKVTDWGFGRVTAFFVAAELEKAIEEANKKGMRLPESGPLGKTMAGLASVNALLTYSRLVYIYGHLLRIDVALDPTPLERTRDTRSNGKPGHLTATLRRDFGDGPQFRCLSWLLAAVRVKLGSLPDDGPIENAAVEFVGFRGFRAYSAGEILTPIVEFFGGRPDLQVTDAKGQAHIGVEGLAQRKPVPRYAHPVRKTATVQVLVQLKRGNLLRDLIGLINPSPWTLPAELLERTRWLSPTDYTFEVTDWEGDDYRVRGWVSEGRDLGIYFSGVKCGGVAGEWRFSAERPDGTERHCWLVTLNDDLRGTYVEQQRWYAPGYGSTAVETRGEARFVDRDPPALKLKETGRSQVTESLDGSVYKGDVTSDGVRYWIRGSNGAVSSGTGPPPPHLPSETGYLLEPGAFCEQEGR